MSRKLTEGCYTKLGSARETTGVRIAKTTSYPESIKALINHLNGKRKIYSTLNSQTLSWIINKE